MDLYSETIPCTLGRGGKHHWVVYPLSQKGAGPPFRLMWNCKLCSATMQKRIEEQTDGRGNIVPKVIITIELAGEIKTINGRVWRLVGVQEQKKEEPSNG